MLSLIWKLFNHNWEIIQPQFLIDQHFLVFDKRKFKKKVKSETPSPAPSNVKVTFQGTNRFLILAMW